MAEEKDMPPSYITIPEGEYRVLMSEVKRGMEVCEEAAKLRVALIALERRIPPNEKVAIGLVRHAAASSEEVSRMYVELSALERHLRQFDQELTPVRPHSRTDIRAAFENSVGFAQDAGVRLQRSSGKMNFSFESKKDPRFCGVGAASSVLSAHTEITRQIEELERKFGCDAPDDIETNGMKI